MKKLANILVVLICCNAAVLVSSCSNTGQSDAPVKIGINGWVGHDPLILAGKTGLFNKNNVQVEIKEFTSSIELIQALRDGEIHGAGLTLDETFTLVDSGFNGKIVLVLDYSTGGDMLIGQKDIKSIDELVGKVVGYEKGVVGAFLLNRALDNSHVHGKSATLIDVPADQWLSVFREKKVDALVCFNPVATILLDEYEGNLLFSSAEMPFEIIDVLFFSESFYVENKVAIGNVLGAWFDARSYTDINPDKAIEVIAPVRNITPEMYKKALAGIVIPDLNENRSIMDSASDKNIYKHAQVIIDFMLSRGLLSKRIATVDLFESELLFEIETGREAK